MKLDWAQLVQVVECSELSAMPKRANPRLVEPQVGAGLKLSQSTRAGNGVDCLGNKPRTGLDGFCGVGLTSIVNPPWRGKL